MLTVCYTENIKSEKTNMNTTVKILIAVLITLGVVAALLYGVLTYQESNKIEFDSLTISRGNIENTLSLDGVVRAEKREALTFGAGDRVRDVNVALGDEVKKDDSLIVFENEVEISAPFDGTIIELNAYQSQKNPGVAGASQSLAIIADLNSREFIAEVEEDDFREIELDQQVRLECDIRGDGTLYGKIIEKGRAAKTRQDGSLYFLVVSSVDDFSNVEGNDTFTCSADVVLESKRNIVFVPFNAVTIVDDKNVVYLISDEGEIQQKEITTGLESSSGYEVLSGLRAGDRIAADASSVQEQL